MSVFAYDGGKVTGCEDCPFEVNDGAGDFCVHPDLEGTQACLGGCKGVPVKCPLRKGPTVIELGIHCTAYMKAANVTWRCDFLADHEGLHYDGTLCFEWGQEAGEPPSEPPSLLSRGKRLLRVLDELRSAGRDCTGIKKQIHTLSAQMNKDDFDAFEALIQDGEST